MGEASCEARCQACHKEFVIVGRRRRHRSAPPAMESVACPHCKDVRRTVLAPDVEGPITAVYTAEDWGHGASVPHAPLDEEDLSALEQSAGSLPGAERLTKGELLGLLSSALRDVPSLVSEVRRLRAENAALTTDNEKLLARLRSQA